jgi:hypothetical protein
MSATNHNFYPLGSTAPSKSLTVSSVAIAPDAPVNLTGLIHFSVHDAAVVWLYDGQDPTSSFGHELTAGYSDTVTASVWSRSKFIQKSGTDARIQYSEVSS